MTLAVTLADVQAAAERIRDQVRRTPLLSATQRRTQLAPAARLLLKLENLQVIGSFKARGAMSKLTRLPPEQAARGLITASGGNHGLGVAYAAWRAGVPARIYLPRSTPSAKADKMRRWSAEVVLHGAVWDEANAEALLAAERDGMAYVHPFADPAVIAGQGTVALEVLEDASDLDTLLVAIGGGGLIAGIATAAKGLKPGVKVIGVEPVGAPTLHESLAAGRIVELGSIATTAGTLAPRRSDPVNLEIVSRLVERIVLVDDDAMREAARWLWFEFGIAAEMAGAAAIAALQTGAYRPAQGESVCAVICGSGTDGLAPA